MDVARNHTLQRFKSSHCLLSMTWDTHLLGKGSVGGSGCAGGYLKRTKCLTVGKVENCRSYTLPSTRLRTLPLHNWAGGGMGCVHIYL